MSRKLSVVKGIIESFLIWIPVAINEGKVEVEEILLRNVKEIRGVKICVKFKLKALKYLVDKIFIANFATQSTRGCKKQVHRGIF